MQLQINSANINTFFVKVSFDIYNRKVIFDTSGTTYNGAGATLVKGISFSLIDQAGIELADGGINWTAPQIQGPITPSNWIWTLDLSSLNFAFLYQTYQVIAAIQDQDGTVYQTIPVFPSLCQPNNVTDSGYVPGMFQITPDTINSVLTVKELTQLVYNSLAPISTSKSGTLYYPTGTISPLAFTNTPFTNNVVYSGQYNIQCATVGTYSLGNDIYVLVSYITNNVFPVTVGNSMSNLLCCVMKLQQEAQVNCDNAKGDFARQQMLDILPYMLTGFIAETSGQDSSAQAAYIQQQLGCNCGSASQNQSEFTPINPAVTSIVLEGVGGTSVPSPTTTGNTQTYNIASNVYQVVKGNTGDLAFTISTNTSTPYTVQYVITINYNIFASSILTAIAASPTLLNQLNALVTSGGFSAVGLNGLCVINLSQISYTMSLQVTNATTISNIVINGTAYNAPTNTYANNQSAVQTWLDSLALGTPTVTVNSNVLTVSYANSANIFATMSFANPSVTQAFQSSSATLNQVLQAIFNYVCNMTASQVALGAALNLCSFDYNGNIVQTAYSTTQGNYNSGIAAAICNIVNRMNTLTGVTCTAIKNTFGSYPNAAMNPSTDWLMSVIGGNCTQATLRQAALGIISAVNAYSDVKTAWCAIQCSTPATCPDISNINANGSATNSIALYGVSWGTAPTGNQIATVKYRVHGTSVWLTSTNALNLFPNGNINGVSPYVISGLTAATSYDVWVINNCGGVGFQTVITTSSTSVYNTTVIVGSVLYALCGTSPITLYSSAPFAPGVALFNDAGLTSPATGHLYVVQVSSGEIYNMNSGTGVIGADTGTNCGSGVAGTYLLGNSTSTICSGSSATYYTNGAFATGSILYQDSGLTTPVTGYSYVVANNTIYNLNSVTGAIGGSTGLTCSSGFTPAVTILGNNAYSPSCYQDVEINYNIGNANFTYKTTIASIYTDAQTFDGIFTGSNAGLNLYNGYTTTKQGAGNIAVSTLRATVGHGGGLGKSGTNVNIVEYYNGVATGRTWNFDFVVYNSLSPC